MKTVKLSQFAYDLHLKKLTEDELKKGGSFRLLGKDGEVIALVMFPISAEKRDQLEGLASQMNMAIGIS